jgi:hypothetical protein
MRSLCVSITSPAALENLKLRIWFNASNNYDAFYEDLRRSDVWHPLDSIIAHLPSSRLRRVDNHIILSFYHGDNMLEPDTDEILKAVHDGLPLLHEKCILFVKVTAEV